jgi:aspartate/methionine/tyrosine aminotransferase
MFSKSTDWYSNPNRLTNLLRQTEQKNIPYLDLTQANPTTAGLHYPEKAILAAFTPAMFHYEPHAFGLHNSRLAVQQYYAAKGISVNPEHIILTTGSSEAYSWLFKLLCDPGQRILAPTPSYPLLDYLTDLEHVRIDPYPLIFDGHWSLDMKTLQENWTSDHKALIIISPHNPTGWMLDESDFLQLLELAESHGTALIIDEVFTDYVHNGFGALHKSALLVNRSLIFTLNGLSKSGGLPQMKAGWMVLSGRPDLLSLALSRLELIADTYLAVSTPVQQALPALIRLAGEVIQPLITERILLNMRFLKETLAGTPISLWPVQAGWYALLQMPAVFEDEEWALRLLEHSHTYVHPGYFFDLPQESMLVVSPLTNPEIFQEGINRILELVNSVLATE